MIEILLLGFLATYIYTPYGYIIQKGNNIRSYSLQLIFAIIILTFFALLINFFNPISEFVSSFFILLGILIIIKNRNIFLKKKYIIFCFLSSIIIFLLITSSNVYRPDAGLYHLPFISILNNEKIIFGLSNLHFRYGHTSILQYTSAIFNNLIFTEKGISFPSSLIAASVILNFLSNLNLKAKKNKIDVHFFILFSFIIFIFYKMNRYSEYGNDAPTHLLMFLLISEILKTFKTANNNNLSNYLLICFFIVMNKIILLLSLFFPLVLLLNRNVKIIIFNIKNIFIILFIILWIIKNIIISGCILYPVKISCLDSLKWTNLKEVEKVSVENEAWAKGWPDFRKENKNINQKEYSKNFNWVMTWTKNHFIKITKIITPYLIFLASIIFFIKNKKDKFYIEKYLNYLIFISIIGTIFWIYKVPVFRYGYSYLIILISLSYAYILSHYEYKKNITKFFKISVLIFLSVFILKNLNRIIFENRKYYDYPWPKIYSMNRDNKPIVHNFKNINGKRIYYTENDYCMYGLSPCGISIKDIKLEKILNYYLIYRSMN